MNEQEQRLKQTLEENKIAQIISKAGRRKVRLTIKKRPLGRYYIANIEVRRGRRWKRPALCKLNSSDRRASSIPELSENIDRIMGGLRGLDKKYLHKGRRSKKHEVRESMMEAMEEIAAAGGGLGR